MKMDLLMGQPGYTVMIARIAFDTLKATCL